MTEPVLLRGDARNLPLPDASVDLIVTSPPYFALRSYTDGGEHYAGQIGSEATPREFIDALVECTREWMRVLKPSGSIFVNLGDKYAGGGMGGHGTGLHGPPPQGENRSYRRVRVDVPNKSLMLLPERYRIACVDELGLIARAVLIWSKPNGLPESVTDRVRRSHEDWVHLTKMPRYFAAVDEIREPYEADSARRKTIYGGNPGRDGLAGLRATGVAQHGSNGVSVMGVGGSAMNPLGKLPGSVWEIASQPLTVPKDLGVDHFAAFPMEWPRRLILGWSPPGGVIVDPFGGTGTTALVASVLGRVGISVDLSGDYCRLAQWRTTDPKQHERAQRPAAPRKPKPERTQADWSQSEWLVHFASQRVIASLNQRDA